MLEKNQETMHLNMQKIGMDPGQVLDNLIIRTDGCLPPCIVSELQKENLKDVMNKQGQFIRKVIGTYCKLLLPWHSDGCCQTKSNDHQGA